MKGTGPMSTDGITERMNGTERSGGAGDQPAGVTAAEQEAGATAGEIDRIVAGIHHDPHSVLGAHPGPGGVRIRALLPLAATAAVVLADGQVIEHPPVTHAKGSCERPLTREELSEKFLDCATRRLDRNQARALFDQLWDIVELPSVRELRLTEFRQHA